MISIMQCWACSATIKAYLAIQAVLVHQANLVGPQAESCNAHIVLRRNDTIHLHLRNIVAMIIIRPALNNTEGQRRPWS